MQKGRTLLFLIFIQFLLIISLINAVELNTQSTSNSLCPRETGQFTHTIRNDNNVVREYTLSAKGNAAAWTTITPSGFILAPGEQKNFFTYVTPSQSAESGNYELQIEASSQLDSKIISHVVTIKNCYGVNINPMANKISSCPSDAIQYNIRLSNNGEYIETFHLTLTGNLASSSSLSDNLVILRKGENKNILIFVNSPKESGEYTLSLAAESESGRVRQSVPLFLTVNPCYDFKLTINGNNTYSMCDRSYVVIPLNLKNDGTTINNYKVNVDGPIWARAEKTEFTLRDKEARSFNLIFAPDYGTAGEYAVRLNLIPESGNVKSVTDFAVTVRKCHSVNAKFLIEKADACKGTTNNYEAIITNDGEIKKAYRIELDSPPWTNFDERDRTFILSPKSEKKIIITGSPTNNVEEQNYAVKLKVAATDESGVAVKDESELILKVKNADDCYKTSINTKYKDLIVYYDSSIAVPIEIRNDGLRNAEFTLFLSGNAATFSTIKPSALTIQPGKSEFVFLYIAPNINIKLGNYDAALSLNVKGGPVLATQQFNIEVTNVKGRATILQPQIISNQQNQTTQEVSSFQKLKSWFKTTFLGSDQNRIKFSNNTAVITVAEDKNQSFLNKYKYYILGTIIILLVIILLVILFTDKKDSNPKKKKNKKNEDIDNIKEKVDEE